MSKRRQKLMKKYKKVAEKMSTNNDFLDEIIKTTELLRKGDNKSLKKAIKHKNKSKKKVLNYVQLYSERRALRDKICKKMKKRGWIIKLYDLIDIVSPFIGLIGQALLTLIGVFRKLPKYFNNQKLLNGLYTGAQTAVSVGGNVS